MPTPDPCSPDDAAAVPTILVVDDEPVIRELVALLLEEEGYTVRQACDGVEALREVDEDGIDLVLSDVKMPHLDGISLAHRLGSRERSVPVVLMSAVGPKGTPLQVPFLRKPFTADHLLDVLAAVLVDTGVTPHVNPGGNLIGRSR